MSAPGTILRKRLILLFFLIPLAFFGLILRVAWIQFVLGDELRAKAEEQRVWEVPVQASRGEILDRNGNKLAISVDVNSVFINPAEVRDADEQEKVASFLSELLGIPKEEIERRINRRTAFEWIARKISEEAALQIREADLRGVYLTQESNRVYPRGELAAQVLGFTGIDNQGLEGIEFKYDRFMRGRNGQIVVEYDALNHQIPQATHRYIPPVNGYSVQLTIDETIQYFAERELEKAFVRSNALEGRIIVMDPKTGEILAMAVRPSFDLNDWQNSDPKLWRNSIVSNSYSPGSVFKPITAAAAIDMGLVGPNTPFYDNGRFKVPGHTITNWNGAGLGATNFTEGFEQSANTIFARVAIDLGLDRFYDYLDRFGFMGKTGIDLPGEADGIRPPKSRASQLDLAIMGFGQTLTVTPIQLATAVSAIANGGNLMRPHLFKALLDEDGNVVSEYKPGPVRRVISPETSATLRSLMEKVVDEGTGGRAHIQGYRIGGKTGTTEKVSDGRIVKGKYIASFIGFAPLEDPRLLIYVQIDEPQGVYYGGTVAAPVFEAVMRDSLKYLGIPPTLPPTEDEQLTMAGANDRDVNNVKMPDLLGMNPIEAKNSVEQLGLQLEVLGNPTVITKQFPAAGTILSPGDKVLVITNSDVVETSGDIPVPDLRGRSKIEAAEILAGLNLRLRSQGSGVVVEQNPLPGTTIPSGSDVEAIFAPEGAEGQQSTIQVHSSVENSMDGSGTENSGSDSLPH